MKQYSKYKNSGIDWLGNIPEHWEVKRVKDVGFAQNGLTYSPEDLCEEDKGILVLRSSNIQDGKLSLKDNVYVKTNVNNNLLIQRNDILICSRNGSADLVGKLTIIDKDIYATFGAFMLVFRSNQNEKYLSYLLDIAIKQYKGCFATSTINQLVLKNFNIFELSVPPLSEQTSIAAYLDEKTANIDRRIELLRNKIDNYKQLRRSLISQVVTRGLNPDVKLKNSGIEWLGDVPEHWEVKRVKDCANIFGRIGFRGYTQYDLVDDYEGAITLSPSNMKNGTMDYAKCSFISWDKYYESPEIQIQNGDILIVKTGSTYGKSSFVESLSWKATINPQIVVLKDFNCNPKFLFYTTLTPLFNYQVSKIVVGGAIPTMSQEKMSQFYVSLPPLTEQTAIAAYLDEKTAQIDSIIGKCEKQIEQLSALRRSLIAEAVTGKIKVC